MQFLSCFNLYSYHTGMKYHKLHILLILFIFTALLVSSCREDIISPLNTEGTVNVPVRVNSNNSYTFALNANKLSTTIQEYPGLNSQHSTILISINDYKQGNFHLQIYQYPKQLIYDKTISNNTDQLSERFDNISPDVLKITFTNYTGTLKIQVNKR